MRGSKTTRLECQWFAFEQGVSYGTDLVHGRLDFIGSKQYPSLEIVFVKVADTDTPKCFLNFHSMGNREYRKDAPRQTSFLDLFRLGPSRGDIGNGETCPMNQIQVNIPHPELQTSGSGTVIHDRFFLMRTRWQDCREWTCQCLGRLYQSTWW